MITRGLAAFPILLSAVAVLGLASCSESESPTSPGTLPAAPASSEIALGPETVSGMDRAIQDEYQAEASYARVLADFGNVVPFSNIVNAEERHTAVLARVYQNHGMSVPESQWNVDNVPRFDTVRAACARAAQEEIINIEMYDELLAIGLPTDVALVFHNNRRASRENHLPAFQSCASN